MILLLIKHFLLLLSYHLHKLLQGNSILEMIDSRKLKMITKQSSSFLKYTEYNIPRIINDKMEMKSISNMNYCKCYFTLCTETVYYKQDLGYI